MADRRITDLDPIGALATGDLFVVTDANQADIAKSATIDTVSSYVVAQVPSSARPFGSAVNDIAVWAEGNNLDVIPASKLPAGVVPDLSNYVTLDTTQTITGVKNFTNLRSNSQDVVTIGNDQTITGEKTFSNVITTFIGGNSSTDTAIKVAGRIEDRLTGASYISLTGSSTTLQSSNITLSNGTGNAAITSSTSGIIFNTNSSDRDFLIRKQTSGEVLNYNAGIDTLTIDSPTTFFDTAIFSSTDTSVGSIQVNSIRARADATTRLEINSNFEAIVGGTSAFTASPADFRTNKDRGDYGFNVLRNFAFSNGTAFQYNAGTDATAISGTTVTVNGSTVAGSETGTWTPVFNNGGTEGTVLATYSRSGQNVIASCNAVIAAGAASPFFLSDSSLPFPIGGITTTSCTYGSFSTYASGTFIVGNVFVDPASTFALFLRNDGTIINGDDLLGTIEFSITYQTDN